MPRNPRGLSVGVLVVGWAAACGRDGGSARLWVSVAAPGRDTVRFTAAAIARPCRDDGGGVVLEGLESGSGIMVWLRPLPGDPRLAGSFGFPMAGDTAPRRRASVGVRFMSGAAAYGVTLDSGLVTVREIDHGLAVDVRGAGLQLPGATRAFVEAGFEGVRVGSDRVPCEPEGS